VKEYVPDAGDLIWEQGGRRPALVLSPAAFYRASRFVIVCPITSTIRHFGTSVLLPPGLPVAGEILTSHVRSIDTQARPIRSVPAAVPAPVLAEARAKLAALIGFQA
jgi:mRNA interferase MazF